MFTHPQFKNITLKPFFKKYSEANLRNKLAEFFPEKNITFTDSGRSAFQIAIKELGLENSEMLVPAYICDIFLPIFEHYNIKPIYLDIDLRTFNVVAPEIENKITPKTKSILVCHTYGNPADMDKILEIAKKYNLKIIEDCAHIFPKKLRGDCAFFSLPKFLPVVNGGMLVFNKAAVVNFSFRSKQKLDFKISALIKFLRLFPCLATLSEKLRKLAKWHSLAWPLCGRAKLSHFVAKPSHFSLRILNQYLENFEEVLKKRKELAEYFHKKLQEIGFQSSGIAYISALVPKNINRDELFYKLRAKHIFCSRIWQKPIFNPPTGGLPNTAEAAKRIINFPLQNWFEKKDIDKIISCILSSMD